MERKRQSQLLVLVFFESFVADGLIGWNGCIFSEAWTNWNLLSFACQSVLFVCGWRELRRRHVLVARWFTFWIERLPPS
jgi:hypothetical protein